MSVLQIAIEVVGWLAAALILASYVLLSLGRIEPRGYLYQWMYPIINVKWVDKHRFCIDFSKITYWNCR